jgi:hypothetical protein
MTMIAFKKGSKSECADKLRMMLYKHSEYFVCVMDGRTSITKSTQTHAMSVSMMISFQPQLNNLFTKKSARNFIV